jgi:hypothetical protein
MAARLLLVCWSSADGADEIRRRRISRWGATAVQCVGSGEAASWRRGGVSTYKIKLLIA